MKIKRLITAVTMAGFLASTSVVFSPAAAAAATTSGSSYISYATYKVVSGDTLWIISQKYKTTVDNLVAINGFTSTELWVGQTLKVPQAAAVSHFYVHSGDTLYLIAQRFGTTTDKLLELNSLANPNSIYPGQCLAIPGSYVWYTVKSGDTLYIIAKKFGTSVEVINRLNYLKSTMLNVGQALLLPCAPPGIDQINTPTEQSQSEAPASGSWSSPPSGVVLYHVVSGDNLWTIANKYDTTKDAISQTNNLHSELINPGQPLFIPVGSTKPVTITAPSVSRKAGYGELLDWEYANWIFNTGSTAILQDVDTGRQFQIYRIGGANHADCEPLTKEDTAVMLSLFGGSWSWKTRAVLLKTGDRVIAASMAGMPHSFDTVSDNDFYGMFDLHFLNSRTHNTNTVDSSHQKMVQKAAGN